MKPKYFFCFLILCISMFVLNGCSPTPSLSTENTEKNDASVENSDHVMIGSHLSIQNIDSRLQLSDNMDALAADGLYYAAWTIGNSEAYENSDGDTVDLYDAQLYLLLGEFKNAQTAQNNMDTWLAVGKENYEVISEESITCNGQSYTLITYNCVNEDNPYARGLSAFGVYHDNAVCIELTCREHFQEDLASILTDFLEHCTYMN